MVLDGADWGVIGGYFAIVLGTGLGISFFSKSKSGSATDFLLAGRSLWFLPVAFSLFSSNIGSSHFIGLAGTGAAAGIAVGAFEWNVSDYFLRLVFRSRFRCLAQILVVGILSVFPVPLGPVV